MKIVTFAVMLFFLAVFFAYPNEELLKKSLDAESSGNYLNAVRYLKEFAKKSNNDKEKEKTYLKIARLTEDFKTSIMEYNFFLNSFPKSRFRFFARFELAFLYYLNEDFDNSKKEFYKIAEFSKGTPYWQSSLIEATKIEIVNKNYEKSIKNLYEILNEIDDYDDIGICYFLLGSIAFRQENYLDAEEFFLISAGSFPQSPKAAGSLLELLKLYLKNKNNEFAIQVGKMIGELYSDSPENNAAFNLLKGINSSYSSIEKKVELINLNENPELKRKTLRRLREDLRLSNEFEVFKDEKNIKPEKKIFVQIGFFSQHSNALEHLKNVERKKIEGLFIKKTKSTKNDSYFYRILIGPYNSKEKANEKLIEIKEKNIESIILELNDE
ncbi:MAG TPA: SPOR domain-containing protein [Spirochaetota bacterium]|nr:SPOR domain-containing protein [Spirochaetota bacterium]